MIMNGYCDRLWLIVANLWIALVLEGIERKDIDCARKDRGEYLDGVRTRSAWYGSRNMRRKINMT